MKNEKLNENLIQLKRMIKMRKNLEINYLFILIILNFSLYVIPNNKNLSLDEFNSEVTLKIKGTGNQKILRTKYVQKPDNIYLNNEETNSSKSEDNNYEVININTGEENTVKIIWNNFDGCLKQAFRNLSNITEIDLSKLNKTVNDSSDTFNGCSSLTSINLLNLDTSEVTNMGHMFANCISLISVDLSSFNTSTVKYIDNMFLNCLSLKSLNLLNFDISKVIKIESMFQNCVSLTSLNLSTFSIKESDMSKMFMGCNNLQYLNIWNSQTSTIKSIVENTAKNIVICLDTDGNTNIFNDLEEQYKQCITLGCPENWIKERKMLFAENNSCIDNCKYSFEDKCYDECPNGTFYNNNNDICEIINYKNLIYENDTEVRICEVKEFFNEQCKNNLQSNENKETFKNNILTSIKNGSLSDFISTQVKNGSYLMINDDNEIYLISTLNNQIDMENITSINFSECESLIRDDLNNTIGELYALRIDHKIEGYNIPIIEYAIFDENGTFLNLDKCDNIYSQYYIPVSINENNLYKYDSSSDYYNDDCSLYKSENGKDMTMYDRKNDYNENHLSLCEANCTFKGYNSSTSKVECECKTKSYLYSIDDLSKNDLLNKIENEEKLTNLNLIKCSNLLSSVDNIKNNSGFYVISIIIILFIIIMIIFCIKGYKNLENKIDEVISIKFKPQNFSKKKVTKTLTGVLNQNNRRLLKKDKKPNTTSKTNSKSNLKKNNNINNKKNIKVNSKKPSTVNSNNKKDDFMKYTNDYELNNLSFELALKHDNREFCDYYFSLIRTKQLIFFSFCDFNDYNSGIIKKFIFFLSFALHYTINALFFTDKIMHKIYEDEGKYNIIYQFPFITYSAIISSIILRIMLTSLVLTEKNVVEVKKQQTQILASKKKKEVLKYLIIKFSLFFIINLILLIGFGYYLTCFNALYQNTQIDLILNSFISFGMSCVYPFFINIIPAFVRNDILKSHKNNKNKKISQNQLKDSEYAYKISQWLQLL